MFCRASMRFPTMASLVPFEHMNILSFVCVTIAIFLPRYGGL